MYNQNYTVEDSIVTEFIVEVIESALVRFNITYDELDALLVKSGYFKLFNDTKGALVGVHYGVNEVLDGLEAFLE